MNKYILIYPASEDVERARRVVGSALPGGVAALYTYLHKSRGLIGTTTPVTAAWWPSDAAAESLLLLLDWNVETSELSSKMSHLSQSIVAGGNADYVLAQHLHQHGYTEVHHAQVVAAADLLKAIQATGMSITHVYNTRTGDHYGAMVGIDLTDRGNSWLVDSITQD